MNKFDAITGLVEITRHFEAQCRTRTYTTSSGESKTHAPTPQQIEYNTRLATIAKNIGNMLMA